MRNPFLLFLIFTSPFIFSCFPNRVADTFQTIQGGEWGAKRKASFDFEIRDTAVYYNFFINLRITEKYPYSNIFILMETRGPGELEILERVEITLASPDGKWLGSGLGDVFTYRAPAVKNRKFRIAGKYSVILEQYMRVNKLPGVREVGVSIDKGDEIY